MRLFRQQEAALANEHALQRAALRSLLESADEEKEGKETFQRTVSGAETEASGDGCGVCSDAGDQVAECVEPMTSVQEGYAGEQVLVGAEKFAAHIVKEVGVVSAGPDVVQDLGDVPTDGSCFVESAFQDEGKDLGGVITECCYTDESAFQDEGADAAVVEVLRDGAARTAQVECISDSECEIIGDRCDQLTSEERQTGRIAPPTGGARCDRSRAPSQHPLERVSEGSQSGDDTQEEQDDELDDPQLRGRKRCRGAADDELAFDDEVTASESEASDDDLDREYDQLGAQTWAARLSTVERVMHKYGLQEAVCIAAEASNAVLMYKTPTWTSSQWVTHGCLQDVDSQVIIFRVKGTHTDRAEAAQCDADCQLLSFATCMIAAKMASALGPDGGIEYQQLQPHLSSRLQDLQNMARQAD